MATVLFNKIKLGGANAISISYSSSEIKYVKHGDGTLYYDTQSSTIYDTPSISLSYSSLATAKGGTLSPSLSYSQKWRKVGYSGNTYEQTAYTSGATVSYSISGTGATIDSSTGVVTWASLGTTISDGRTAEVTVTVTKSGKSNTAKYTVRLGANSRTVKSTSGGVVTYGAVTAGTIKNATVPAAGGSGTATAGNGSQSWSKTAVITTYEYTSGSTSLEQTAAATSGTDTISPSHSSLTKSGSNLGTSEKAQTTLGSQTVKWSGGGGYSKTGTMYVYQEANALTGEYKYEWAGTPSVSYVTANCNGDTLRPTVSAAQYKLPYYTSGETPNATSSQIIDVTPSFSNLSVSGTGASVYSTITGAIKWTANSSTSSRDVTVSGKLTANNISTDFSTTASQEGKPAERTFTISFDSDTYDTLSGAMISMVGNNYDYIDSDFTDSEEWYTFTGTPITIYVDVTNATGSTVKYSVSGAYGCTVSESYYTCGPTDEGDDYWSITVTPSYGSGDFGFTLNSEIIDVSRTRAVAIDDSTADASVTLDDWSTGSYIWTAKDSDSGEWFTFGIENTHGWYDNIFNWDFVGYPSGTILDSGTEHLGPGEIAEITVSTNSPIGSDTDFNFEVRQD